MAKIPAYFTVAFDFKGAVKIQQIQYREVLEVDGELLEVKQYPPDLIKAPQDNDLITGLLKDATDAIAAGAIKAVAEAQADRDTGIAAAEEHQAARVLELKAKATAAEERFGAVEGERIEALMADVATKDANIQALMAELQAKA